MLTAWGEHPDSPRASLLAALGVGTLLAGHQPPASAAAPASRSQRLGIVVTAVGAGGKTSVLHAVAEEAARAGWRVVITTTTKMAREPAMAVDLPSVAQALRHPGVVVAGTPLPVESGAPAKFTALPGEPLRDLCGLADLVLVEGDGSRRLPVKAPAAHEPVVPEHTARLLVVAGLSAVGEPWERVCYRPDAARALLARASTGPVVTAPALAELIDVGYLRHPALATWARRRVVVLNQADDPGRWALGRMVAAALPGERVVMTSRLGADPGTSQG